MPALIKPHLLDTSQQFTDMFDGNRKCDALCVGTSRKIDTDQFTIDIHERSAGVAGVDAGVDLDSVLDLVPIRQRN